MAAGNHQFNGPYTGDNLTKVAFPLGGIGAGMLCFEGCGALSHVSLRGRPEIYNEPLAFSALWVEGLGARVLEGPVPEWKLFFPWADSQRLSSGNGGGGKSYGLPRFARASFLARFPFATLSLGDSWPLDVEITGWSPFVPGDADASSLPVAGIEVRLRNRSRKTLRAVYSFHSRNFLATGAGGDSVSRVAGGFVLRQAGSDARPQDEAAFAAVIGEPGARVDASWFRGGWWDPLTMVWKAISSGKPEDRDPPREGGPSPGASTAIALRLAPGAERTVRLLLAWYAPRTDLVTGKGVDDERQAPGTYSPWYAARFGGIEQVLEHWKKEYARMKAASETFARCFYDTTLPPAVVEAIAANLTILKSPTVLRQADGRLWCWEGCCDSKGCCPGSCTHVWNYAQAIPHLFPALERSLRWSEFHEGQDDQGQQSFRVPLPIRKAVQERPPAADGQLGGIIKVYRDWRVSGDTDWLRSLWPLVKRSIDYCISHWDPDRSGLLVEPHHNTYDIEFWGADGMCGSFYAAALRAAALMAEALGDDPRPYQELYEKSRSRLENELFDGEYFVQHVQWKGLRAGDPTTFKTLEQTSYGSAEARELLGAEGPKYQYGPGCLSDGVLGAWMAEVCGVGEVLDRSKVTSHLASVYRYNFRRSLEDHANPQRPTYAVGGEPGLLLCSWPKGGKPSLPMVYSDEVWTGIEYQVASHLILRGRLREGLAIVEAARCRYDGRTRNPFNEYECGHWYGRAQASYALLQALTGARYDAVERVLTIAPAAAGDFRAFLATATGYGTVGVKRGKPFVEVKSGRIVVDRIDYRPAEPAPAGAKAARRRRPASARALKRPRPAPARRSRRRASGSR